MKSIFLSIPLVAILVTSAAAGNLDPVAADPIIPVIVPTTTAPSWAGAYVGLSYSSVDTEMSYSTGGVRFEFTDTSSFSGFGGYNWQRNNLVYGAELQIHSGLDGISFLASEGLNSTIEIRGRGGYAFGQAMAYAFVGYAVSDYYNSANE